MEPSIVSNNMNARIPYGRKMESPYVETLQIPGLTKKTIQIHITPKMITAPLISLGVLCHYGCTITLYQ